MRYMGCLFGCTCRLTHTCPASCWGTWQPKYCQWYDAKTILTRQHPNKGTPWLKSNKNMPWFRLIGLFWQIGTRLISFCSNIFMALNVLSCADAPLRKYSTRINRNAIKSGLSHKIRSVSLLLGLRTVANFARHNLRRLATLITATHKFQIIGYLRL